MNSGKLRHLLTAAFICAMSLVTSIAAGAAPPWAEGGPSRGEDLVIELTTFGQGSPIITWFGHSVLIVKDTRLNRGRLYNFGMFRMNMESMDDFAAGNFEFYVADAAIKPVYRAYRDAGRDVRIQRLDLPATEKKLLAEKLVEAVAPENRYYVYDHYLDNCSTRIRDLIDAAVDGQLKEALTTPTDLTFRDHTRRMAERSMFVEMLLMYLENYTIDKPIEVWDELFLPGQLEQQLENFSYTGPKGSEIEIVESSRVFYDNGKPGPPDEPPMHWPWFLGAGLFVGLVGFQLGRNRERDYYGAGWGIYSLLVGLLLGLPGTSLFIMATMTNHDLTYWNENLFLASPLSLLACYAGALALKNGVSNSTKRLDRRVWTLLLGLAVAYLPLKLLPWLYQDNLEPMAFIYPILVLMAAGAGVFSEQNPVIARITEAEGERSGMD